MSLPMGQEPSNTDGQVPADVPQVTTAVTSVPVGQEPPKTFDAAYVADLRKSEAATRKRATELEARLKELDDAKLSETERLTKRATELEAQLAAANAAHESALIRAAVEREAHAQGAVKADVVYRLVDRSAITLDDSGEIKGADKAVKALLDAEPYLKAVASGTAPINGPPRSNGQAAKPTDLVDDYLARTYGPRQAASP